VLVRIGFDARDELDDIRFTGRIARDDLDLRGDERARGIVTLDCERRAGVGSRIDAFRNRQRAVHKKRRVRRQRDVEARDRLRILRRGLGRHRART
jgi:hypothetical protein